jgi:hypothetical protein
MRRIADTGVLNDDDNELLGEAIARFGDKFKTEVYGILPQNDK